MVSKISKKQVKVKVPRAKAEIVHPPAPGDAVRAGDLNVGGKTGALINSGYSEAGASAVKRSMRGMPSVSISAKEDIHDNLRTLRGRSRNLYMSAPLATSAINLNRTNVVGTGLKLKSTIDRDVLGMTQEQAADWQKKAEAEFRLWSENKEMCDALGMNDFYRLQGLVLISSLLSGDVFVLIKREKETDLLPYSLRLHVIEADRVRTPCKDASFVSSMTTGKAENGNPIYDGVEVNGSGKVVAYHVANNYPFQFTNMDNKFVRIPAKGEQTRLPNILHVITPERPEQYRGVPYLAHVIEPLLQINRYTEAEIQAAIVQSFFTAFVTTKEDPTQYGFNEAMEEGAVPDIRSGENEYQMGPGTINIMAPGEEITFSNPTHPQTGFDTFVKAMAQQVGAALEIPQTVLMKAFVSNYTAARGELMEAWKAFKTRREWLADDFCRPVYELVITEAVARGRLSAPGFFTDPLVRKAYLKSEWIGPSQGQLDPKKEVEAAILNVQNGFSNRETEAIKLSGSEYASNVDRLAEENRRLAAALEPLNRMEQAVFPNEPEEGDEDGQTEGDEGQQ